MRYKPFYRLSLFLLLFVLSCSPAQKPEMYSFFLADTFFSVKTYEGNLPNTELEAHLRKYADQIDRFKKGSLVWKLNNEGHLDAPAWFCSLIELCIEMNKETKGAFDITLGELSDLWGFPGDDHHVPVPEDIKAFLAKKRIISVEANEVKKENCVIDLGAVGKGFLLEIAQEFLKDNGINTYLLNFGGNVSCWGNRKYKVGLQDPRDSSGSYYKVIKLDNNAVSTSGDYQRYFFEKDKRYCHIFDPLTGYPATGYSSVSVICNSAVLSDILSTAFFVAGESLAGTFPDAESHFK
ncbi:FAD:protein FMN transferase [bacterium]|nr:FAD:protein FMN transferase [bacterium]